MTVLAGHTRLKAARALGMSAVPVHVAEGLTPEQKKAYRIADNKVGERSSWDEPLLSLEISELSRQGFDLDLLGFDPDELDRLMDGDPPDNEPDSSAKEIDPDDYQMGHTCPKCGFEFDDDA